MSSPSDLAALRLIRDRRPPSFASGEARGGRGLGPLTVADRTPIT
jgi:hypothetical protein